MLGATWNVHLRVPPSGRDDEQLAAALARRAGQLLDEETLGREPLRIRFAYLRKYEAERLFKALRENVPNAVVWIEMEQGLGAGG